MKKKKQNCHDTQLEPGSPNTRKTSAKESKSHTFHQIFPVSLWYHNETVMSSTISQNLSTLILSQGFTRRKQKFHKSFLNLLTVPPKFGMRVKHGSPVTQMRLDGKQVFVEAFDGFFLEDKVDPPSSIQHSHFNLRLLRLFCWHWGLKLITHLCRDRKKAA